MTERVDIDGAAHLVLTPGVVLLHPEEAVLEAMLTGWAAQQRSHYATRRFDAYRAALELRGSVSTGSGIRM